MLVEVLKAEFERVFAEKADPADGLLELVNELTAFGMGQREIYGAFDEFRAILRTAGREADEDSVMDTMDRITGWCSPHQRLFGVYSADFWAKPGEA